MKSVFNYILLVTLLLKLALAALLPMSGDEAYFLVWARHLDFGYYDHPPMVGWFLHLLMYLGSAEVILRLPAILTSTLIGYGIYRLLRPLDEGRAALVAILYLISPLNLLNVLVTTDTPLILFAFLSGAALYRALQRDSMAWYAVAGALLGMAFLSKYFAVLLGLGYLAYFIFSAQRVRKWQGFALLVLAALPFALVNLYWNYTHCWDNILFNLYTRNEGAQFSPGNLALYLLTQVYLLTPLLFYYLYRNRSELWQKISAGQFRLFFFAFVVPLGVFTLLSFKKVIGLHWVLAFYPFAYLLLFQLLSREQLSGMLKFMGWFSAAHLALVLTLLLLPLQTWQGSKLYESLVFTFKTGELVEKVRPYETQGFLLATDGYSPSAIISYHYGKEFFVFGEGGLHARQDDMVTDFRAFDGHNILILTKAEPVLPEYAPYFAKVEV
ncbi:MAG TPA: glycosyltransferase family 39 protein, partial [Gallionella sp.]|nr:glycosyltransferase family 39 protein [Gallionella sp.]